MSNEAEQIAAEFPCGHEHTPPPPCTCGPDGSFQVDERTLKPRHNEGCSYAAWWLARAEREYPASEAMCPGYDTQALAADWLKQRARINELADQAEGWQALGAERYLVQGKIRDLLRPAEDVEEEGS